MSRNKSIKSLKELKRLLDENDFQYEKDKPVENYKEEVVLKNRKKNEDSTFKHFKEISRSDQIKWLNEQGIIFTPQHFLYDYNMGLIITNFTNPFNKKRIVFDKKDVPDFNVYDNKVLGQIVLKTKYKNFNDMFRFTPKKNHKVKGKGSKLDGIPVQTFRQAEKERTNNIKKYNDINSEKKKERQKKINESIENFKNLKENEKICLNDFVVQANANYCMGKGHMVEDIIAAVLVLTRNGELRVCKRSAGYCHNCDRYFIEPWQIEEIRKIGIPLCQIIKEDVYRNYGENYFDNLKDESILKEYGYSVNALDDLSSVQRRNILALLIDAGICSKYKITSHITWLIDQKIGNPYMANAVEKWKSDRDFVRNYKVNQNRVVYMGILKEKRYRTR